MLALAKPPWESLTAKSGGMMSAAAAPPDLTFSTAWSRFATGTFWIAPSSSSVYVRMLIFSLPSRISARLAGTWLR